MLNSEPGTVKINMQINIDPRMPAVKVDYIFECMHKHLFAPQRADTEARDMGRRIAEGIQQITSYKR